MTPRGVLLVGEGSPERRPRSGMAFPYEEVPRDFPRAGTAERMVSEHTSVDESIWPDEDTGEVMESDQRISDAVPLRQLYGASMAEAAIAYALAIYDEAVVDTRTPGFSGATTQGRLP